MAGSIVPSTESPGAAPPIRFADRTLAAPKRFVAGTHRAAAPEETLERIRPHFGATGVTRLADITGLDRIGVTTVISYRPNSRTLATSAGKGFTRVAAAVSAAMEAIELYHAENVRAPTIHVAYDDLPDDAARIPLDRLPLSRAALFSRRRREFWVTGWDLISGGPVWLPYATVAMGIHPQQRPALSRPFVQNSNGLASGNHLLEALSAALHEVIERDAVTTHELCERRLGIHPPRVRPETIEHPLVRDLLDRFEAADVVPVLYDCGVDTDVPTYMASIHDRHTRHVGIAGGYGAHLDPEIAMIRALTEAAQSRLIWISGARDDIFRHEDEHAKFADSQSTVARLEALPATVDGRTAHSQATATFEGDLHRLLDKLIAIGVEQVIAVDLTHEELDIPVVRVVVPGLEGYLSRHYAPGPRALAFCRRHAA